LPEKIIY